MTKRIHEAGTISIDAKTQKFRVCLITEGEGSSATFPRSFFVAENAQALAGSLSFPGHPADIERPDARNPLSAIGSIGDVVTIEEVEGKMGFWADYIPAASKPEVGAYLAEYADKLGLSIYADSDGHADPETGRWVAESISPNDPYKSVDLVVAAGRGGKFERVAEGLRRIQEASATAGEKKENLMEIKDVEKVVADALSPLTKVVEGLVSALEGKAKADLQVEADADAVAKAVEGRLGDYDKAVGLISEAKLTESQSASLRELAKTGVDITPHVETAKKVLAEARAGLNGNTDDAHLGDGGSGGTVKLAVAGFGKVS